MVCLHLEQFPYDPIQVLPRQTRNHRSPVWLQDTDSVSAVRDSQANAGHSGSAQPETKTMHSGSAQSETKTMHSGSAQTETKTMHSG